jgi:hypothetical protein
MKATEPTQLGLLESDVEAGLNSLDELPYIIICDGGQP